jgi:hypothetical protein
VIRRETATFFGDEEANCEYLGRGKIAFGYLFFAKILSIEIGCNVEEAGYLAAANPTVVPA